MLSGAISACEKGRQWALALKLLCLARDSGIEADVVMCGSATSACEKGGRWGAALELLAGARRRGVEPNLILYNAALAACERGPADAGHAGAPRWATALGLLDERQDLGIGSSGFHHGLALRALQRAGLWRRALLEFQRARAAWAASEGRPRGGWEGLGSEDAQEGDDRGAAAWAPEAAEAEVLREADGLVAAGKPAGLTSEQALYLYYVMLCYIMLCYVMSCYIMLCDIIIAYTIALLY